MPKQTQSKVRRTSGRRRGARQQKKSPTPDRDDGAETARQLKKQQNVVLNYLGPSFRTAYRERQLKTYFERVYFLWFLIFPQTEQEIKVNKAFLDDPDYEKHIVVLRRKLVHGKMCWASSLFPKMSQEDGPVMDPTSEVAWIREMKLGIQGILKEPEMPTSMWSDDIFRRIQELGEGI